ncbi:hypothetical protein GCM10027200_07910 [Lentzea nigeriaca]
MPPGYPDGMTSKQLCLWFAPPVHDRICSLAPSPALFPIMSRHCRDKAADLDEATDPRLTTVRQPLQENGKDRRHPADAGTRRPSARGVAHGAGDDAGGEGATGHA